LRTWTLEVGQDLANKKTSTQKNQSEEYDKTHETALASHLATLGTLLSCEVDLLIPECLQELLAGQVRLNNKRNLNKRRSPIRETTHILVSLLPLDGLLDLLLDHVSQKGGCVDLKNFWTLDDLDVVVAIVDDVLLHDGLSLRLRRRSRLFGRGTELVLLGFGEVGLEGRRS
jgi:hypothetical protein